MASQRGEGAKNKESPMGDSLQNNVGLFTE
jgi:hypothetical protein